MKIYIVNHMEEWGFGGCGPNGADDLLDEALSGVMPDPTGETVAPIYEVLHPEPGIIIIGPRRQP